MMSEEIIQTLQRKSEDIQKQLKQLEEFEKGRYNNLITPLQNNNPFALNNNNNNNFVFETQQINPFASPQNISESQNFNYEQIQPQLSQQPLHLQQLFQQPIIPILRIRQSDRSSQTQENLSGSINFSYEQLQLQLPQMLIQQQLPQQQQINDPYALTQQSNTPQLTQQLSDQQQLVQLQLLHQQQQQAIQPVPQQSFNFDGVDVYQKRQELLLQFYNLQIELLQLQSIPLESKPINIIKKDDIPPQQQQVSFTTVDQQYFNQLFYKVFHNIVIFKSIFKQVRLFKKNEKVEFKSNKQLVEYKEREYIHRLIYDSYEMLKVGDLPNGNGVELKTVEFGPTVLGITGDEIPFGVETLEFNNFLYFFRNSPTSSNPPFQKLPSTIHTIDGAYISGSVNTTIPSNITSISFTKCPCISNGDMVIPNTIKTLELRYFNNDEIPLKKGDIPESVTNLLFTGYQFKGMDKDILPSSIKQLTIPIIQQKYAPNSCGVNYLDNYFNFLPPNVEILDIATNDQIELTPLSQLPTFKSIKKLSIYSFKIYRDISCKANSLPPNLTELSITNVTTHFDNVNILPNSITNLELYFSSSDSSKINANILSNNIKSLKLNHFIVEPDVFPSSLTHFHFIHTPYTLGDKKFEERKSNYQALKMVTLLPQSLTSIILPQTFKKYNLCLPQTIINVQYEDQSTQYE